MRPLKVANISPKAAKLRDLAAFVVTTTLLRILRQGGQIVSASLTKVAKSNRVGRLHASSVQWPLKKLPMTVERLCSTLTICKSALYPRGVSKS
jgi:hypothetical protein